MQHNKGMRSEMLAQKQYSMESRNKMEMAVSLINKYHAAPRANFTKSEASYIQNHIENELKNIRNHLPKWFATNVAFWLKNEQEWLNR